MNENELQSKPDIAMKSPSSSELSLTTPRARPSRMEWMQRARKRARAEAEEW